MVNPLEPKVHGEPYNETPGRRAADHSRLARMAEGYRLYEPLVQLLFLVGLPFVIWRVISEIALAPGEVREVRHDLDLEIRRSQIEDSLSRAERNEHRRRIEMIDGRSNDTFRAVCFMLDYTARNALDCPRDLPAPRP